MKARDLVSDDTYPKWITRALDSIAAKGDDVPLTNTETEALLRYHHGDEWFLSDTVEDFQS